MSADNIAAFALTFIGCAILAVLAYKEGKRDGIALGWHQYRDEQIARDKARRDRIGRFRAKGVE